MKSLSVYEELIVFDCETTGLDPFKNHVIEIGSCLYELVNGEYRLKKEMNQLIKVDYLLSKTIINLTGITDIMLNTSGCAEAVAAMQFDQYFINNSNKKKLYIAYNAPFDIQFIDQLLKRHNLSLPEKADYLDLLTLYKDRAQYPHRLENAIAHYGLTHKVKNSHRAIDDCEASFEVLKMMSLENDDIIHYVNLFGYNPKYPVKSKIQGVTYKAQPYNSRIKLYN